jgi:hypothetical protein
MVIAEKGHKLPAAMVGRCSEKNYLHFTNIELIDFDFALLCNI